MYRLLIVDDEPIIVNGLVDFFSQQDIWPLEVYGAVSAEEALMLLGQTRMDIVISDIGMPDMDGLELQKRIVRHWPRCKVIFLTGFNDFGFVQEAMRHQGFDYVLKAEGDDAVLKAVDKAIAQTKEDIRKEELLKQADKQMRLALPSLQKEILRNIVQGDLYAVAKLEAHFSELHVPLAADKPVIAVLVRVDNFRRDYSVYDRSLLIYSIQNVAQEYLQASAKSVFVELDISRMMWFVQPETAGAYPYAWDESRVFVKGCLELIQQTCKELLGTPLSIIMKNASVHWTAIGDLYAEYTLMMSRGLGMGAEFLWVYEEKAANALNSLRAPFNSGQLKSRLDLLLYHLQNGNKEGFDTVLTEVLREGEQYANEPLIRQQIYYSLVPVFLGQLNRCNPDELDRHVDIGKLTTGAHASWAEAAAFFQELSLAIFVESKGGMEQEENVVVQKIQRYVHEHLDGDVSLVRIGDAVGHNSKYLSRLYKKIAGEDLSGFISRAKLSRAQSLLQETNMKIYEVAAAVGFLSEPYFYRFFRKAIGMTPQEYRDLHGG